VTERPLKELRYERAFREWAEREGYGWERALYPRPRAGGDVLGFRLTPRQRSRGIVLAVHGAGNDALFALVGLFKRLLPLGFEIFTFDLDGHGRFSTTRFSVEAIRGSVLDAAERARAGREHIPLHGVGVSLGGAILLSQLPDLDPAPASVTLLVAPLRIRFSWGAVLGELGRATVRTLWRERQHYGLTGLIPSFGPFKRSVYPLRFAARAGGGSFSYIDALNRALDALDLPTSARRTRSPVLLIYGGRDRVVPAEQGHALYRLLNRSEILVLERETHLSTPLAPIAVERLLDWIERHSVTSGARTPLRSPVTP
jgi:alpha-beta hydrolase superfamily lysophospholipase